jgi:hypothetical protein
MIQLSYFCIKLDDMPFNHFLLGLDELRLFLFLPNILLDLLLELQLDYTDTLFTLALHLSDDLLVHLDHTRQ